MSRFMPSLAAKLLLAVGAFAAFGIAAELAARLLCPDWAPVHQDRLLWRYDALLGWANTPNHTGRLQTPEFSIEVQVNANGLRDRDYAPLPPPGMRRMLVIGDSFAWGMGVDADARFSEILERRHPSWEIINAGCSGYGTDQEVLYLQHHGLSLKPDVVLLLFAVNDFANNVSPASYTYYKPYFSLVDNDLILRQVPVPPATLAMRLERILLGRTYAWGRLYTQLGLVRGNDVDLSDVSGAMRLTFREITDVVAQTRAAGALPILVTTPLPATVDDLFRQFAADFDVLHVPLSAAFDSSPGPLSFTHDPHWNTNGHAVAADAIDRALKTAGVW